MNILKSGKNQIIALVFITVIVYSNIFQNQFALDDKLFMENWPAITSWQNIGKVISTDSVPEGHLGFRPIRGLLYLLAFNLWGLHPFFYHLLSLLIHLTSTVLIYFITIRIITLINRGQSIKDKKSNTVPFITALLFGIHPIHTESVTFMTAGMDNLGTLFLFGSLFLYLKAFKDLPKYSSFYILSVLLAFLAIFTYEITIILPLLFVLFDLCFGKKYKLREYFKKYLPYFSVSFLYVIIRVFILEIGARGDYIGGSLYLTFLTMVKVIANYVYLLILPFDLSINPIISKGIWSHLDSMDTHEAILAQSFFDTQVLLSIFLIIALIAVSVYFYKKNRLITFLIGWFFISLLPVLFIVPQALIMQERYLYVASFSFCLLLGYLITKLLNQKKDLLVLFIIFFIFATYSARTYTRNTDWYDNLTLWTRLSDKYPEDAQAAYVSAITYQEHDPNKALYYYQRAIKAKPGYTRFHIEIGNLYLSLGRNEEAISSYKKARQLQPDLLPAREFEEFLKSIETK